MGRKSNGLADDDREVLKKYVEEEECRHGIASSPYRVVCCLNFYFIPTDRRREGERTAGGDASVRSSNVLHPKIPNRIHRLLRQRHVRRLGR